MTKATGGSAAFLKALDDAIGDNDEAQAVTSFIDTGYEPLNMAMSGRPDGGIPQGRLTEVFGESSTGKTAMATKWMVTAQEMGGVAIFQDWERSFDVGLAQGFGLNIERPYWIYKRPKTWEEGNVFTGRAVKAIRDAGIIAPDAPIIAVHDSIAAAIPASMLYDSKGNVREMDTYNMNDTTALARVTSTTLKTMAQIAGEYNATFVYLNQMRLKPGVCVRYDTPVLLADGTWEKIGKVVHSREAIPVVTVDTATGEVQIRPIDQFHRNPHDGRWIQVKTSGGKNGFRSVFFTPEHQLHTPDGWKRADEVKAGDKINTVDYRYYSDEQHEIILGSLLGDGQIRFGDGKSKVSQKGRLRMVHGMKQGEYLAWKAQQMGYAVHSTAQHFYADSASSQEFEVYKSLVEKRKTLLKVTQTAIDRLTVRAVAIWFMDDGSYSAASGGLKYGEGRYTIAVKGLSADDLEAIAAKIAALGMGQATIKEGKGLIFSGESAKLFGEAIQTYVPECMAYKLNRKLKAQGDANMVKPVAPRLVTYAANVLEVNVKTGGTTAIDKYKYDIGVGGTHTFVAGGMVVHNCYGDPRTTPGGKAMEFYATVRLAIGREKITEGKGKDAEFAGQRIGIQVVKSKLTKPFQTAKLRLMYDENEVAFFDTILSCLEFLTENKGISTAGSYIEWVDGSKSYPKALAKKIHDDPAMQVILRDLVVKALTA